MSATVIHLDDYRRGNTPQASLIEQVDEAIAGSTVWGRSVTVAHRGPRMTHAQLAKAIVHVLRTSPCPVLVLSSHHGWEQQILAAYAGVPLARLEDQDLDLAQWQKVAAARRILDTCDLRIGPGDGHDLTRWRAEREGQTHVVVLHRPTSALLAQLEGHLVTQGLVAIITSV